MGKTKLTIEGDFKQFKVAAAMADVEILDAVELGKNMIKAEISFKQPTQLRDLGRYEVKVAEENK